MRIFLKAATQSIDVVVGSPDPIRQRRTRSGDLVCTKKYRSVKPSRS